jgi:hypothetical protein
MAAADRDRCEATSRTRTIAPSTRSVPIVTLDRLPVLRIVVAVLLAAVVVVAACEALLPV